MTGGATCSANSALQYVGNTDTRLALYSAQYDWRYHGDTLAPGACLELQHETTLMAAKEIKDVYLQRGHGSPLLK